MGEIEAVADVIAGGIFGRAMEPVAGEGDGHTHAASCLNCGTALVGPHCHQCGQHAHVHRSLTVFFHDLAHGVFHLEGKLWRTIPLLVWKPGELTRRYIEGQRASFVSPIALFLFCVFFMFGVVGLTSNTTTMSQKAKADATQELATDQQKLSILEHQRSGSAGPIAAALDQKIGDLKDEERALQAVEQGKIDASFHFAGEYADGLDRVLGSAAKNPELLFYKLKTNAYKFSWALIPISLPFVWSLFPFSRRFKIYDHIVFVTYSLCFMMLLLAASSLVGLVSNSLASVAWFVPPVHMYRQLRGAYAVSRSGALWRTALLTIYAFIAISMFASLLVMLGVFD